MAISSWSTTAANNDDADADINWLEGQAPSTINNSARAVMAKIREWYEDAQWINLGYTHTYASATSFTIAGTDVTAVYHKGRRIRAVGSSTGTIYGTITAASFSTNSTITVSWDSGSLSSETLTISIAAVSNTNNTLPYLNKKSDDVASASTIDLDAIRGDLVDVTGTTTITAITLAEGQQRVVRFTEALTLTHGASLVLPGSANITTAAEDFAIFRGYASSVVRCVGYFKNSGNPVNTGTNSGQIPVIGTQSATESLAGLAPIADSTKAKSFTDDQAIMTSLKVSQAIGQILIVQDQKASGTDGGTFTTGAWQTRTLNTVVNNGISGASLSSNQITLPAGTYQCDIGACVNDVQQNKVKLRNITDSSDTLIGLNSDTTATSGVGDTAICKGVFTIASSKVFEVQHQGSRTQGTTGYGAACSYGVVEVYCQATFIKIA